MRLATIALVSAAPLCCSAQVLIDSISYEGLNQGLWGIHVMPDTIFLGADFSGSVYYSDHDGNLLGSLPTGYDFNHGLIRKPDSYLIAEDFTTGGAGLYEVSLSGALLNSWTFPPVIGGNSSGIGDLCADGDAVWYTMYFPDFDAYPYAYAYKWVPGEPTPIDTVPLMGEQPYGIALRGDTLFYVTDNLNGDLERIYAYDLTNEQLIGSVPLPDSDNDQSPRGLFCSGDRLYLVANRSGGSAFAFQMAYIYALDGTTSIDASSDRGGFTLHPSPADELIMLHGLPAGSAITITDLNGRVVMELGAHGPQQLVDSSDLPSGIYAITVQPRHGMATALRCVIAH
ncbi:MAG: T9SS type A sorting domain-containing protein [Flavobacteriales bacterium]|nr:T9SS type A sorting domain-containing protein [Flavobacteriales bacterium]